jgi:type I restriction enzyme M protein
MADEYSKPPFNRNLGIPDDYSWARLAPFAGAELEDQYNETLKKLGDNAGTLGRIFTKAQKR